MPGRRPCVRWWAAREVHEVSGHRRVRIILHGAHHVAQDGEPNEAAQVTRRAGSARRRTRRRRSPLGRKEAPVLGARHRVPDAPLCIAPGPLRSRRRRVGHGVGGHVVHVRHFLVGFQQCHPHLHAVRAHECARPLDLIRRKCRWIHARELDRGTTGYAPPVSPVLNKDKEPRDLYA